MNSDRSISPDMYHAEYVYQNNLTEVSKVEDKTLTELLNGIAKDVDSHFRLLSLTSEHETNESGFDITGTPLLEYIQAFRRMATTRQVGEGKAAENTSAGLAESHGTVILPREIRTQIALRREYYQVITLGREAGKSRLSQMSDGLQVGGPGEATIRMRKEYGDKIVQIHNHPEQSSASLVDLVALDAAVDAEIITTPDRFLIVKRVGEERDYDKPPTDWFNQENTAEVMNKLYDIFDSNGCEVTKFVDDEDIINTYGLEMLYSVFSFAAAKIMEKEILFSTNESPGEFRVASLPSNILPSLKQRMYGKNTNENKLFQEILDLVKEQDVK